MKNVKNVWVWVTIVLLIIVMVVVYNFTSKKLSVNEDYTSDNKGLEVSTTSDKKAVSNTTVQQSKTYLNNQGIYVVEYTNNGFVPASLKIPRGKAVKFVNNSSKGMRIFSSDTDPKFVEINEAKTIGKGSSYTFSFIYSGLWMYYNQAYPVHTASILVY